MREFTKYENANAILNGMEDCVDEFVEGFIELHKQPINNTYMYDWVLRSLLDVIKTDHSVLYIACGTAGYRRLFHNMKRFVGIDFSKKMIEAARKINSKSEIDCEFHCTTFEEFNSNEKFDIIYLGPYGHNVPYTSHAIQKARDMLKEDGMIFCTIPDPQIRGFIMHTKEFIKNLFLHKTLGYQPVKKLEKMLKKSDLETYVKLHIKTCLGYAFCLIVKPRLSALNA